MKLSVQFFSLLLAMAFLVSCGGGKEGNNTDGGNKSGEKNSLGEAATVNAPSGLTLRSTPKTEGEQVTLIPNKEAVTILDKNGPGATIDGKSGSWYKIKYKEKEGYVFSAFLSMGGTNTSKGEEQSEEQKVFDSNKYTIPEAEDEGIVAARSGVILRDQPSTEGKQMSAAPYEAKIKILSFGESEQMCVGGRVGSWYKVKYKDKEGYVFSPFVRTYNGLRNPMYMLVDTKSGVTLRDQPTAQGEQIIVAPDAENVEVVEECDMLDKNKEQQIEDKKGWWIKVKYKGKTGYVFSGFLKYYSAVAG
ncbi:hypothetical protein BKI52_40190 [marine bacterium AO1-C]|nr:hypothetical protein BKI52_40190 [marine bacterium AO1-C]